MKAKKIFLFYGLFLTNHLQSSDPKVDSTLPAGSVSPSAGSVSPSARLATTRGSCHSRPAALVIVIPGKGESPKAAPSPATSPSSASGLKPVRPDIPAFNVWATGSHGFAGACVGVAGAGAAGHGFETARSSDSSPEGVYGVFGPSVAGGGASGAPKGGCLSRPASRPGSPSEGSDSSVYSDSGLDEYYNQVLVASGLPDLGRKVSPLSVVKAMRGGINHLEAQLRDKDGKLIAAMAQLKAVRAQLEEERQLKAVDEWYGDGPSYEAASAVPMVTDHTDKDSTHYQSKPVDISAERRAARVQGAVLGAGAAFSVVGVFVLVNKAVNKFGPGVTGKLGRIFGRR